MQATLNVLYKTIKTKILDKLKLVSMMMKISLIKTTV